MKKWLLLFFIFWFSESAFAGTGPLWLIPIIFFAAIAALILVVIVFIGFFTRISQKNAPNKKLSYHVVVGIVSFVILYTAINLSAVFLFPLPAKIKYLNNFTAIMPDLLLSIAIEKVNAHPTEDILPYYREDITAGPDLRNLIISKLSGENFRTLNNLHMTYVKQTGTTIYGAAFKKRFSPQTVHELDEIIYSGSNEEKEFLLARLRQFRGDSSFPHPDELQKVIALMTPNKTQD